MNLSLLDGKSLNPQPTVLARLMADLPELFSEGRLDPQKLKAVLGQEAFAGQERYGLSWNGKSECFKKVQETTTKTLRPCREESVDFDTTENLFIEGDNLQVLKVLQRSYYGNIKMIYIDPPYNTGSDFIYSDKFTRTRKEELVANGSINEQGNIISHDLYRQNTRDSGHFHSNWLNMMYPRLFVAKSLLKQDGVIFVSIDDNEVKNLRAMLDEIFGEENFIAEIVIEGAFKNDARQIGINHEYCVVYAKNRSSLPREWSLAKEGTQPVLNEVARLKKQHGDDYDTASEELAMWYRNNKAKPSYANRRFRHIDARGAYKEDDPTAQGGRRFDLVNPRTGKTIPLRANRGWVFDQRGFEQMVREDRISFISEESIMVKRYLHETVTVTPQSVIYLAARSASERLARLLGAPLFEFPKDENLLAKFVSMSSSNDDIILDFFAGSGTTAHAVMQINAEDGGNRKWICVQLPEKCKPGSAAAEGGFVTIADVAKERIRRAGRKIRGENADSQLDTGFKVFKLDESNFKVWNTRVDDVAQLERQLFDFIDNVRPDARPEDLLYELILKTGRELNVGIDQREGAGGGKYYHRIGDGALIICLADALNEPLLQEMLQDKPKKIIVLDRAFANNDQLKTNLLLQAEQAGVEEFTII